MPEALSVDATVELTGLPAASPIGFMAALGLLRVCAQDHGAAVRLSWGPGCARLHGMTRAELTELLGEHMRGRSAAPEFNFEVADGKGGCVPVQHLRTITPQDYRLAVEALAGDERALGFMAGFGTDTIVTDKGFVARTALDFSSGQQKLVEEFRSLAAMLDPAVRRPRLGLWERIARSLFGGPYEEQHTLGWDPVSLMAHAHQRAAPTDSPTPGQPMTVWLAVEALPLHPLMPESPRRARTAGFAGSVAYVWPQWEAPLSLDEVRLLRQRGLETLAAQPGVAAVWSSAVTRIGKYGFLRPGARTWSVGAQPGVFAREETDA